MQLEEADALLKQIADSYSRLRQELAGLTDAEAQAFRISDWPRHPHWRGEDGSIAGILRHVGAWKAELAHGLSSDTPLTLQTCPADDSAAGLLEWLEGTHTALITALESYLVSGRPWPALSVLEGMDLRKTIAVWQDHDRYHMAQIAYLRQRFASSRVGI